MSVINALFLGMGKVIPYFKMTPEIAQQLNKNLAKVMMYVKSKGITLTQKQQDYITGQTKQLDMYEQSITPPTAKGPKATVTDITERLGPEAPYSTKNPEGWMPTEGEESAMQARGIMSEMGFNQNIVDDTINLLKDKDPKSLSDELKNIMLKKGTYADYNDAERKAVLDGIQKIIESRGGHLNFATGGRVGFSKGKLAKKGLEYALEKLGKQVTTADKIDRPEKAKLKEMFDDFNKRFKEKTTNTAMFDEEPVQMSMNDLIKYRSENPAGKGRFTKAEAIIARLENTIQGAKDNPDETSDYVLKNFPNMIEELKNKPELANNENVWKELGMTGLPKNQRFKIYDDGTVDFETLKPTHTFKLKEEIKRKLNASGGLNYLMGL
jgi:hypothetical protein